MILTLDNWIALVSIFASIVVAFFTALITIRISLQREKNSGRIILFELLKKYFLSVVNSYEIGSSGTGTIKTDPISKEKYLNVIIHIESSLLNLEKNQYYSRLLVKYPLLTLAQVRLSQEIAEQRLNEKLILNYETQEEFWRLYKILKKDLPRKYLKNKEFQIFDKYIISYISTLKESKTEHLFNKLFV